MQYNTWTHHRKTKHPESDVDEKNEDGIDDDDDDDDDVDHIYDADESNNEVKDRGKRPVKPAKRRLSEPKTNVSEDQKATSTSASKET